jgi:biotin-(acetyl-CoA carboxylase) ligase
VLVEGQKICGILIEQGQGVVVGIGLNVTQHSEQFTKAGLPSATSLQAQVAHATSTYAAARQLLTVLDNDYKCLCQGMLENLEMDWANHLGLLNQEVEAECLDGNWQGRLVGISFAGLHLKEAASMRTLLPERIQHLRLVAPGEEPIP